MQWLKNPNLSNVDNLIKVRTKPADISGTKRRISGS
jgi:hypothetical protein